MCIFNDNFKISENVEQIFKDTRVLLPILTHARHSNLIDSMIKYFSFECHARDFALISCSRSYEIILVRLHGLTISQEYLTREMYLLTDCTSMQLLHN